MTPQRTSSWLGPLIVLVLAYFVWRWRNGKKESGTDGLRNAVQMDISANQQDWFDHFHPTGTARSVTVHEARRVDTGSGRQADVRFTLYWSGPITTDGFTKIRAIYDGETQRWVRAEVLETNGTTNAQIAEGIGIAVGALLAE